MTRYIDAEKIRITAQTETENGDALVSLADVRRAIEQTPTADVVEVVRCKECVHSQSQDVSGHELWTCLCDGGLETICENCAYYDERKDEQPCCACVEGCNFEKGGEQE